MSTAQHCSSVSNVPQQHTRAQTVSIKDGVLALNHE